ncbi:hypothetical protein HELRODRAFT_184623 [Helobdella robusta]|uniref:Uncharacterized protein n=1 Tax=Helobdella robusta TaxID=6412 RepID=T1FLL9_HELRO|nr:hypothetical protein HELRODRAFT_184623 [Helobdella robusta]ESO08283.1 hypothetical protein HELRODRAFT_184623 [Helobdella robusta]
MCTACAGHKAKYANNKFDYSFSNIKSFSIPKISVRTSPLLISTCMPVGRHSIEAEKFPTENHIETNLNNVKKTVSRCTVHKNNAVGNDDKMFSEKCEENSNPVIINKLANDDQLKNYMNSNNIKKILNSNIHNNKVVATNLLEKNTKKSKSQKRYLKKQMKKAKTEHRNISNFKDRTKVIKGKRKKTKSRKRLSERVLSKSSSKHLQKLKMNNDQKGSDKEKRTYGHLVNHVGSISDLLSKDFLQIHKLLNEIENKREFKQVKVTQMLSHDPGRMLLKDMDDIDSLLDDMYDFRDHKCAVLNKIMTMQARKDKEMAKLQTDWNKAANNNRNQHNDKDNFSQINNNNILDEVEWECRKNAEELNQRKIK